MTDYLKEAQADLALSKRGPHDPAPLYAAQAQAAAAIALVESMDRVGDMLQHISVDLNMLVVDLPKLMQAAQNAARSPSALGR